MYKAKLLHNGSRIRKLRAELRPRVARALSRRTRQAAGIAYQLCPVSDNDEPGHVHTRDTIAVESNARGDVQKLVAGGASLFLEFGTVHMDAQPFLRPAVAEVKPELMKDLRRILRHYGYSVD